MTTISGIIEAITYADDASGFAILQMKPEEGDGLDLNKYGRLGLKGSLAHFCVGDRLKVEGRIENHATYGPQVFVQEVQVLEPQSVAGIKGFLSGRVDLIGDVLAQAIVDKFGMDTLRILDESPERLTEVPGIGEGRAKSIIASWRENTCLRDLIVFMGTVGLPTRFATEIVDKLDATESEKSQKQLIEQIKADPYMLCRLIHGIGWKIADAAAMKMGIPVLSNERIRAAAHYQLGEVAASAGHCFLYTTELVQAVVDTIDHFDMQHDRVEAIIEDAVELKILKKEDNRISLPRMHTIETTVARRLQQIMAFPAPGKITSQSESLIEKALASSGLELAEQQKQAVRMAMTNKVSVLTGGPGTGKTTVLKTVVAGFQSSGLPITLLAPTGRAARRMGDVIGMQAVTIHKRLHSKKGIPPDPLEGIVVVDEISMVDIALMHRLLTNALDDTIFLFVGDKDQLPSVSPGAVLRDLLSCGTVATTTLTEVFRQAAESDIVVNAHSINRGGLTKPNEWSMSKPEVHSDFVTCYAYEPEQHIDTLRWWITQYCPANGIDPLRDVQVMIPQKTGQVGVHAINAFMQRTLNPNPNSFINRPGDVVWGVGDRLMNLKNNYDLDIYNGDIGTLVDVVWEDNDVAGAVVDFDGQRIEVPKSWFGCITLAYAMTIHKSQGSEYPFVIMLLHTSHHTLLQRNIVYTAVTRARQQVVAVVHPQALAIALRSVNAQERNTYLAERLQGEPALVAA